jgi:hypothetical protein
MFDASRARGGLPVLLSRCIDYPAAPAPTRFCSAGADPGFHGGFRPAWVRSSSELNQEAGRAVTNSRDLLLETGRVHPAVGSGLYGTDQSTQLLGERDHALLYRVARWSSRGRGGSWRSCRAFHALTFRLPSQGRPPLRDAQIVPPDARSACVRQVERSRLGVLWGPVPFRR